MSRLRAPGGSSAALRREPASRSSSPAVPAHGSEGSGPGGEGGGGKGAGPRHSGSTHPARLERAVVLTGASSAGGLASPRADPDLSAEGRGGNVFSWRLWLPKTSRKRDSGLLEGHRLFQLGRRGRRPWSMREGALGWDQFGSVAQSCPTLCDPVDCSTPGLPVHHQLRSLRLEFELQMGILPQPPPARCVVLGKSLALSEYIFFLTSK